MLDPGSVTFFFVFCTGQAVSEIHMPLAVLSPCLFLLEELVPRISSRKTALTTSLTPNFIAGREDIFHLPWFGFPQKQTLSEGLEYK